MWPLKRSRSFRAAKPKLFTLNSTATILRAGCFARKQLASRVGALMREITVFEMRGAPKPTTPNPTVNPATSPPPPPPGHATAIAMAHVFERLASSQPKPTQPSHLLFNRCHLPRFAGLLGPSDTWQCGGFVPGLLRTDRHPPPPPLKPGPKP